ncbi:MAG: M20 family metallopeptidase [Gammaproteobacteria bacterium]|nr:M20 family metallopeptidase [Gammaproteobacteria bacterium]
MAVAQRVLDYLTSQQQPMLELLTELVAMESPSTDPESQQPVLARLKQEFEDRGYQTILVPGRNSGGQLYAAPAQSQGHKEFQLMLGHCDTVWPLGTLKTMPIIHEQNMLRGPGVYDMKAGLVEMLFAIQAIGELELPVTVKPVCFINSDEEIGSRESGRYIHRLAQLADRCMVLEPSLGLEGKIKTARKGVGRFIVHVKGRAAHAGLDPTAGASAILELSHVIQKLFLLNDHDRGVSVNVGMIDGGVRPNVVAPESSAIVDVRVENRADADMIETTIHALKAETPGVTLKIEGAIGRPPMERTPSNQQFWQVATDLASEIPIELDQATAGGGSDGNTTSLYTATLDGLGAVGDGAHADHEFIYVDQLPRRCTLLTLILLASPLGGSRTETD